MRRELPSKPNLEHLKSQAKDLLDAHRRGDREALTRIRDAVPAFAHKSNSEIASLPFALHDAQSAIAREYGCVSWAELRTKVDASGEPEPSDGVATAAEQTVAAQKISPELAAALREALALRGTQTGEPTPSSVPVLTLRNAVAFPGALIPIDVSRPFTMHAIEAAMQRRPAFIAVFAQRAIETEHPAREDLHAIGSLCIVRVLRSAADAPGSSSTAEPPRSHPLLAWVVLEGVRFVELQALEQTEPYYAARVVDTTDERGDEQQIGALERRLRELAHRFADTVATRAQAHAVIDQITGPRELADLVMSNFPTPVAEMASYAEETQLVRRLERAIALLEAQLATVQTAPA
jgi:Lon protease-like protein